MKLANPVNLEPSVGQILDGKYKIERVLGSGGMGVVVAAMHLQLGDRVAIKYLRSHRTASPEVLARFQREARAAVRIKGEHVCRILDVGALDAGAPYIVMEHLDGEDLGQRLDGRGPLPVRAAIDWVLQACAAIGQAHALNIIHRDLKPSNLFLARRPDGSECLKVLDFGISKSSEFGECPDLTQTSSTLGSPSYMSPEQLRTPRDVDARSDIWSFGIVLFELLTGRLPFEGESLPTLVLAIVHDAPPEIQSLREDLSDDLAEIVGRCLEKRRDDRFQNVAELARALLPHASEASGALVDGVSRLLDTDVAGVAALGRGAPGGPDEDRETSAMALGPSPPVGARTFRAPREPESSDGRDEGDETSVVNYDDSRPPLIAAVAVAPKRHRRRLIVGLALVTVAAVAVLAWARVSSVVETSAAPPVAAVATPTPTPTPTSTPIPTSMPSETTRPDASPSEATTPRTQHRARRETAAVQKNDDKKRTERESTRAVVPVKHSPPAITPERRPDPPPQKPTPAETPARNNIYDERR